ncbi:hypothetical protein FVQ98_10125 [Ottowia sp. GY511]|uniref:Uncharacterized protein n=1 Tax=Ottowia flava TaxID=2675430 RepID=A0ABW4KNC9_9BURK|nr:hypothetical protein [Ottowia sp. GY511]TXK28327.1 hypothetical protein FVQ98_10125 [Ottowia sp. GY511]
MPAATQRVWLDAFAALGTNFPQFLSAMAERGNDFARLTGVYANWRGAHPDATMPLDFIAAYLSSVKLDAMARTYAFPDSARFKVEATQAGLGVVNAPPAAPQETYLSYRNGFAGGTRQAGP